MTHLGQGVYFMRSADETWEVDEEVGGLLQVLFEDGDTMAGMWKPGSDVDAWPKTEELHARETIVVLEGSVRIEIEDGPTLDLVAGDLASLPQGATTNWHPSRDFIKVWLSS